MACGIYTTNILKRKEKKKKKKQYADVVVRNSDVPILRLFYTIKFK